VSHWDDTQVGNTFETSIDTDLDAATGFLVSDDMTPGSRVIAADYDLLAHSTNEYSYVGYFAEAHGQ
jgi:hypothetical protein